MNRYLEAKARNGECIIDTFQVSHVIVRKKPKIFRWARSEVIYFINGNQNTLVFDNFVDASNVFRQLRNRLTTRV